MDFRQLPTDDVERIIAAALAEDIGSGDITSNLLIASDIMASAHFIARERMVVCGSFIPALVYKHLGAAITVDIEVQEGGWAEKNTTILVVHGPARALLTGERVALNLMQRMCGVATITKAYVDAVAGTKATILDTRKTMPGLRVLDKYAVRAGGGQNHRMGLYDAVMVKDNHVELGLRHKPLGIRELIEQARDKLISLTPYASSLLPIIIECDTFEQVKEAVEAKPDRILLDNMHTKMLKQCVDYVAGKVPLEASGGVSLETVRAIAETGVDYISVGRLTHSAPSLDIGLDMKTTTI